MKKTFIFLILSLFVFSLVSCSKSEIKRDSLKQLALDSAAEIIAAHLCDYDSAVSFDGQGSIRVTAEDSMVVPIANITGLNIESSVLIYQAHLKSENLRGKAYLEMWCQFDDKGEFFSRDLATPLTGSMNWSTEETPFFLQRGQRPNAIRLNLVVTGPGTVWIDDVSLLKMPLR
jgi:hypothetical protein